MTQTRYHSQFFLRSQLNVSKTFGPPAKQILDSFLYTKLQPQLKPSINLTYLENGTYNEILAHLDRELKMSCLETIAEVRIPTMTTTTTTVKKQTLSENAEQQQIVCRYCKEPERSIKECRKHIYKEQERQNEKQTTERANAETYPPCPHYRRTNHTADMC